ALREVPYELADARRLLPLSFVEEHGRRTLRIAMADPLDIDAIDEIEVSTGCALEPLLVRGGELSDAIQKHYRGIITRMIPRQTITGAVEKDESQERLFALVDLLVERGVIDRDAL